MPNRWAVGAIFVIVAGAIVGLALWLAPGQPQREAPAEPGGPVPAAVVDAPATSSSTAAASTAAVAEPAPSPVGGPAAPERRKPAAAVADEEPPPTPDPTTTATSTAPPAPPAPPALNDTGDPMPWCRLPDGNWYSGYGEGCTPDSPYFVEWR